MTRNAASAPSRRRTRARVSTIDVGMRHHGGPPAGIATPDGPLMLGILVVEQRIERARVAEDGHQPPSSARTSSWFAAVS